MQKIELSSQHLDCPAYKKYKYSYFKPNYVMSKQIHRNSHSKSHHEHVTPNVPAFIALKDFQGQKNKWQALRDRMRVMKIDGISNGRHRQNTSKDNKNNSQSEQKQTQNDFFYKLRNPQKQENLDYRKNQSLNYIKHLQVYCSAHFKHFDKQEMNTQVLTSNSKQNHENRTGLIHTGSTQNNRYNHRVTKVYKSNSIAPKYADRISVKRPIGPIEDLIAHPQDLANRLILQRKTVVQNKRFYALQLSIIYDRYVILVNIMGQKTKKLSLVLNKQQSKVVFRQYNKNLEVLFDNLVIGVESLTLKQSFSKVLEQKLEQYRESRNMGNKNKHSHPYLDSNRRLGTPATNISSRQQKRHQKARTSISQLRKRENKVKLNQQDMQLFNFESNANINVQEQDVITEVKSQIGQSKIINNISEQISKDIKQSIPNNSEVIQNQTKSKQINELQLPNQSIKEQSSLIGLKKGQMVNNSIAEQANQSIQQSRYTEFKKNQNDQN